MYRSSVEVANSLVCCNKYLSVSSSVILSTLCIARELSAPDKMISFDILPGSFMSAMVVTFRVLGSTASEKVKERIAASLISKIKEIRNGPSSSPIISDEDRVTSWIPF